jgi:uncharacterized protein YwqG
MHENELNKARAPAIWFRRQTGEASLSKLGGLPALPPNTAWPRQLEAGTPLHFLAQIDLSRLPSTPLKGDPGSLRLPHNGFLFIFADMVEEMLWGENGGPFATTRVIFAERTGPERSPPDDTPDVGHPFGENSSEFTKAVTAFTQATLEPHVIETFGGVEPYPLPEDTYAAAAEAAMIEAIERAIGTPIPVFSGPGSWDAIKAANPREYLHTGEMRDGTVWRRLHCPRHQMLGIGRNIQGGAEEAHAEGLILLMQIDTDRAVHHNFMFCDGGAAQFWIEAEDLVAGRLDRSWGTTEGG